MEAPPTPPPKNATLPQLIDFVLSNNPATKASWAQARAAAAQLGSRRSAYYPTFNFNLQAGYSKSQLGSGAATFESKSWGPSVSMSWLLLDLGGRSGDIGEAKALLAAANLAHDATLLQTLFQMEQAYYSYLSAKSLLRAAEATVKDAEQNYNAADARRAAGVATIADVLQAKTQLSQAELNLQSAEGQVEITRGGLANAAGLPPDTEFQLPELPEELPLEQANLQVDKLLAEAQAQRPDLARARALVDAAQNHTRSVRSRALPQLVLSGTAGRNYYIDAPAGSPGHGDSYNVIAALRFPLFDGFKTAYDTEQAQAQEQAAEADAQGLSQRVALEVWTSYQAVRTAAKRVSASHDLLASAEQSQQVAAGRYHEGAGSVLDLVSAQAALASARAQDVQARADWLIAMAALARDTGVLETGPGAQLSGGEGKR